VQTNKRKTIYKDSTLMLVKMFNCICSGPVTFPCWIARKIITLT